MKQILTILPRFFYSLPSSTPLLLRLYTHLLFHSKTKLSTLSRAASKSTLSLEPTIFTPSDDPQSEIPQDLSEAQIELTLEKLFIPPETDVSSPLKTRVLRGSNIVLSKYARDAQISQAEFVKSSTNTEQCPSDGLPEFALVGRSNVGKSSLLNSIVKRKKLALTSKKPGMQMRLMKFERIGASSLETISSTGQHDRPPIKFTYTRRKRG